MKTLILLCALLGASVSQMVASDNEAIAAATRSYVTANSGVTKFIVVVEQVADDFAPCESGAGRSQGRRSRMGIPKKEEREMDGSRAWDFVFY